MVGSYLYELSLSSRMQLKGLDPVIDENTEVLILGSFPGAESLRKQQYYANNRNCFWKIMGQITGEDLESKSYPEKLRILLQNKIGLWDVFASCERDGSLDKNIMNGKMNDFEELKGRCCNLILICFNGGKAAEHSEMLNGLGIKMSVLPSTSPANTRILFSEKAKQWLVIHKV